jgi:hypothetical protein
MGRPLRLAFALAIAFALLGAWLAAWGSGSVNGPRALGASQPTVVAERASMPEQIDIYSGTADLFIRHPRSFDDWPIHAPSQAISPAAVALTPTDR